ncbi:hypothetical protein ACLKA6_004420 [Drosophila palustris]
MFKKLKPGESEEDVLRMAAEFNAERQKNPGFQPAATVVRVEKPVGKSLFAQKRELGKLNSNKNTEKATLELQVTKDSNDNFKGLTNKKVLLDEIHENMLGDVRGTKVNPNLMENVLGEIVERREALLRPAIEPQPVNQTNSNKAKSIFAQKFNAKQQASNAVCSAQESQNNAKDEISSGRSAIVQDPKLTKEIHVENLTLLNQMREEDILAEREKLLSSLDPALIKLLARKRETQNEQPRSIQNPQCSESEELPADANIALASDNPALELLQQSDEGNWLNFNLIEEHKLAWMRDIPAKVAQLKPGQQFNARFDWKGVLLPHTVEDLPQNVDERELYLHGEEPDRPGYTLQELFRLARSTVLQQRISAFGSIAGIFNIYNQGFYDQVLTLPVSKIFFLLRFGLDDNTPAQLEVVSRALARLFYNETDEILLDHICENAYCHWQPTLQVLVDNEESGDPTSFAFLQRYMNLLRANSNAINADVDEDRTEHDSRLSMDDFQLAETDLMSCLLRTNILQRICFILRSVRPDNSTVESCLKLLIRIARTNVDTARQLVQESQILNVILTNFMPKISQAAAMSSAQSSFYGHPQYLCLKLIRVLICQHLDIAKELANETLIESLKGFLFYRDDIKGKLIRVQIESLRIVRCLLIHGILDRELFK